MQEQSQMGPGNIFVLILQEMFIIGDWDFFSQLGKQWGEAFKSHIFFYKEQAIYTTWLSLPQHCVDLRFDTE